MAGGGGDAGAAGTRLALVDPGPMDTPPTGGAHNKPCEVYMCADLSRYLEFLSLMGTLQKNSLQFVSNSVTTFSFVQPRESLSLALCNGLFCVWSEECL